MLCRSCGALSRQVERIALGSDVLNLSRCGHPVQLLVFVGCERAGRYVVIGQVIVLDPAIFYYAVRGRVYVAE